MIKVKKLNFKNPIVITGFHGHGVVGTVATEYIIDKLKLKNIGFLHVEKFPGVAIIDEGKIQFPIRIFGNEKIIIITSELPIPRVLNEEIAKEIISFCKKIKAKMIICLEGLSIYEEIKEREVYYVSNFDFKNIEIIPLDSGIISGISARILIEGKVNNVKAICLMSEAYSNIPDGKAAAKVIEGLNKIVKLKVDVSQLIEEASEFERRIIELKEKIPKEEEKEIKHLYG